MNNSVLLLLVVLLASPSQPAPNSLEGGTEQHAIERVSAWTRHAVPATDPFESEHNPCAELVPDADSDRPGVQRQLDDDAELETAWYIDWLHGSDVEDPHRGVPEMPYLTLEGAYRAARSASLKPPGPDSDIACFAWGCGQRAAESDGFLAELMPVDSWFYSKAATYMRDRAAIRARLEDESVNGSGVYPASMQFPPNDSTGCSLPCAALVATNGGIIDAGGGNVPFEGNQGGPYTTGGNIIDNSGGFGAPNAWNYDDQTIGTIHAAENQWGPDPGLPDPSATITGSVNWEPAIYCGDELAQSDGLLSEQCDGADLNEETCTKVVGDGWLGTLACNPDCTFNVSGCSPPAGGGCTLALARGSWTATCSGEDSGRACANAIDGDPETSWEQTGSGEMDIQVNIGDPTRVCGFAWTTAQGEITGNVNAVALSASMDGETFSDLQPNMDIVPVGNLDPDYPPVFHLMPTTTASSLKFTVLGSAGGQANLGELQLYTLLPLPNMGTFPGAGF